MSYRPQHSRSGSIPRHRGISPGCLSLILHRTVARPESQAYTGTMTEKPQAYIADAMLGRLAKWLRMLGFDVEYAAGVEDDALVERVEETGRVLVTRDTRLVKRRALRGRCILLTANDSLEQLKELLPHLPPPPGLFSRCTECNSLLEEVGKGEVRGKVPPYVLRTNERFAHCPGCCRYYWPGTHREKALAQLEGLGIL